MTYGQLPVQPKPGVTLYCPQCDEHFSAYKGDYFMADPNAMIQCEQPDPTMPNGTICGASMYLVLRHAAPQRMITPHDAEEPRS